MAESVKNNARRRKPPSHLLNDMYSPDQIDSSLNNIREAQKNTSESGSCASYARLLAKFVNNVNKSIQSSREGNKNNERTVPLQNYSRKLQGSQKVIGQNQKQGKISRNFQHSEETSNKAVKYQLENVRSELKNSTKNPRPTHSQSNWKSHLNTGSYPGFATQSISSLSKLGEDQFKKFLSESRVPSNLQANPPINPSRNKNQLNGKYRQMQVDDTKLFKRASYHVGLAYYIHIEKVKKKGKLSLDDLDPTTTSRRLKQANQKDGIKRQKQEELQKQLQIEKQQKLEQQRNRQIMIEQHQQYLQRQEEEKFMKQLHQIRMMEQQRLQQKQFRNYKEKNKRKADEIEEQLNNQENEIQSAQFEQPFFPQIMLTENKEGEMEDDGINGQQKGGNREDQA